MAWQNSSEELGLLYRFVLLGYRAWYNHDWVVWDPQYIMKPVGYEQAMWIYNMSLRSNFMKVQKSTSKTKVFIVKHVEYLNEVLNEVPKKAKV